MADRGCRRHFSSLPGQPPGLRIVFLNRIIGYARPFRGHILGLLICILLTTGMELLIPQIFRDLIDNALPNRDTTRLNLLALGLTLTYLFDSAVRILQRKINSTVSEGMIYNLRIALFRHLQQMSLQFFTNTRMGHLTSRIHDDVLGAENAISETSISIITHAIYTVGTLVIMIVMEWRLAIAGILVLPLISLFAKYAGVILRQVSQQALDLNAQMNELMSEILNVSGILLVKLFGRSHVVIDRFEHRAMKVRDIQIQRAVISGRYSTFVSLVSVFGTILVYWVGGHLVLQNVFTVGTIIAFSWYLGGLYNSLQTLASVRVALVAAMISFERVFEILDIPSEIAEAPGKLTLSNLQGQLVFDKVSFRYTGDGDGPFGPRIRYGNTNSHQDLSSEDDGYAPAEDNHEDGCVSPQAIHQSRAMAVEDISFSVPPGQLIALVGPSGGGKTTLINLIPRLYDPTSGCIRLDGYDIRALSFNTLTEQIGMVTQDTYLFHDTILANLCFAKPGATMAEIETAVKAANIHDFIMGLPHQYDTVVGERGYRLSGGEKQRIAIARVILKNPRILILDEATSHLDSKSEALIQDALSRLTAGRTTIVIAHRLSTIQAADQILVMHRGRIVERGTHDQLLKQNGLYAQLHEMQSGRNAPDFV